MPSNRSDSIGVILLNWNNAPDTIEALRSLALSQNVTYTPYLVDNGSTDDSLDLIRKEFPSLCLIENKENLGFAEGNNRGIQRAIQDGHPYLFLLNNDAIVDPQTLFFLLEAAQKHPEGGVFGPKIYFYDEPATIWYGGGHWDPARASFYHRDWKSSEEETPKRSIEETGYVCGCAFFFRSSTVEKVGWFDERFFLNWEEIDWCWRMREKKALSFYVPQAKCWHKISSSFVGGKRGEMWNYYYWRNRLLWMEKNLPAKETLFLIRKILWPEIVSHLKTFRKKESKGALLGVFDYCIRRFYRGRTFPLS